MIDSAQFCADVTLEQLKACEQAKGAVSVSLALKITDAAVNIVPGVSFIKDSIVIQVGIILSLVSKLQTLREL
ncbi:MAG: hypothetical protein EOP48_01530 [Sphingobacteriales bacterium]|nr:MAG: hypothetical protein EOP48_01530 [Sphingobacteriales bacterium]